jgi:small GTP-binding protein
MNKVSFLIPARQRINIELLDFKKPFMEKKKIIRKICLLGDGGVGKTSLISRYVLNSYSDEYIKSIGTRVSKKVMDYEGTELTLMIWDVLGQKSQKSLHAAYYRGANGVLLVCDNAREETLLHLPSWRKDLEDVTGPIPLVAIVNKADLESALSKDALAQVCSKLGKSPLYTSAKSGEGVQAAFEALGQEIIEVSK